MNRLSALTGIPESTKGLVRELRVRWMLEELGIPYKEVRYPHSETKKEEYLQKQPFGQVPYFISDDLCMFESGAILLHLALKYNKLIPTDEVRRAHVFTWMFAALNTLEPFMAHSFLLKQESDATETMKTKAKDMIKKRLSVIADFLSAKEFIDEEFSIADIVMTTVLRTAQRSGVLDDYENLLHYVQKNEARPAFKRAFKAHEKLY